MRYRSLASYHPRYIHQFPRKSIRVIAKGSAVLPSRKSAEPFSSYKVIPAPASHSRHPTHQNSTNAAAAIILLSNGKRDFQKCVFSRLCSPSHQLCHYSHSLRLNTFCIIIVCPIPSGDSDSLWYSYSTACTTFGYHSVIRVITREMFAVAD